MQLKSFKPLQRYTRDLRNGLRMTLSPVVLAAMGLIIIFAVVGQILAVEHLTANYGLAAEQAAQWDLSRRLAPDISPAGKTLSRAEISRRLGELRGRYPDAELYLLDSSGFILASASNQPAPVVPFVLRNPLDQALQWPAFRKNIKADDPMDPKKTVYFSVARLPDGHYLFAVLRGKSLALVSKSNIREITHSFGLIAVALGTLTPLLIASIVFTLLFRRIRGIEESAANLAHDLKAPLASTRAHLETLLSHEDRLGAATKRQYIDTSLKNIQSLTQLTTDLMQIWRYESTEGAKSAAPMALSDVANDVVSKFRLSAERAGVHLGLNIQEKLPLVRGDIAGLERVLSNLVDNAIQHTARGRSIAVTLEKRWPRKLRCTVENEGGGLSKKEAGRVFERFYSSSAAENGHCGLGLVICRKIIGAHGGSIWVESTPGKNVRFIFSLPVCRVASRRRSFRSPIRLPILARRAIGVLSPHPAPHNARAQRVSGQSRGN